MLLVANLLKTLGMAGYFFFNNLSWAMKFNIVSGISLSLSPSRHTRIPHTGCRLLEANLEPTHCGL